MQNKYKINNFICVMPMAGEGVRFKNHGHQLPKPLIRINKQPMFVKAAKSFPKNFKWIFIAHQKIKSFIELKKYANLFKKKKFLFLKNKTKGQASTVYKSLKLLNEKDIIIIHSCDLSFKLNLKNLKKKIKKNDLLVCTAKGSKYHLNNHKHFSWVKKEQKKIKVSLKKNFKNKKDSKVLIGSFVFKNKKILRDLLNYIFRNKIKINNEYYMDSVINIAQKLDYKLDNFDVNKYISWGSHNELLNYK